MPDVERLPCPPSESEEKKKQRRKKQMRSGTTEINSHAAPSFSLPRRTVDDDAGAVKYGLNEGCPLKKEKSEGKER